MSSSASSQWSSDDNDTIELTDVDETIKLKPRGRKRLKRNMEPKSSAPWQRMLDRAEESNGVSVPDSIDVAISAADFASRTKCFKRSFK